MRHVTPVLTELTEGKGLPSERNGSVEQARPRTGKSSGVERLSEAHDPWVGGGQGQAVHSRGPLIREPQEAFEAPGRLPCFRDRRTGAQGHQWAESQAFSHLPNLLVSLGTYSSVPLTSCSPRNPPVGGVPARMGRNAIHHRETISSRDDPL